MPIQRAAAATRLPACTRRSGEPRASELQAPPSRLAPGASSKRARSQARMSRGRQPTDNECSGERDDMADEATGKPDDQPHVGEGVAAPQARSSRWDRSSFSSSSTRAPASSGAPASSWWRRLSRSLPRAFMFGRIPVMPLISGACVVVFGGLTLWLQDDHFIKMKPTIVNALFAARAVRRTAGRAFAAEAWCSERCSASPRKAGAS